MLAKDITATQAALLKKMYYSPRRVGALNPVFQAAKKHTKALTRRQVTIWLSDQDAYPLNKPEQLCFKRNKAIDSDVDA